MYFIYEIASNKHDQKYCKKCFGHGKEEVYAGEIRRQFSDFMLIVFLLVTLVEVWENRNGMPHHKPIGERFQILFGVLPNFHEW